MCSLPTFSPRPSPACALCQEAGRDQLLQELEEFWKVVTFRNSRNLLSLKQEETGKNQCLPGKCADLGITWPQKHIQAPKTPCEAPT